MSMLGVAEKIQYTVEEYFELEKNSEIRHEFYYGKLIEMPGESKQANLIANNILVEWQKPLKKKGYHIYVKDVKTQVKTSAIYRYPDLVIAPKTDDADDYLIKQPVLIVEVASDDSMSRDSGTKLKEYSNLPTLQYYIIVYQEEMMVQLYSRTDKNWSFEIFDMPTDVIHCPFLNIKITLSDIYDDIVFAEAKSN
jgi:Uma2 family endonuclease